MRILVVEDEKKVARFIQQGLEDEHYTVDVAFDGEEGLRASEAGGYDLLIFDVMMPKMNGLDLTRAYRRNGGVSPILMLTAKISTDDKVAGLELDTVTHKARRGGREIELTAKEYALLEFFLRNKDRTLSRTIISEHIWEYHFDTGTNLIDVFVNHLRNKVDSGYPLKLLHTVRGVGYILREG